MKKIPSKRTLDRLFNKAANAVHVEFVRKSLEIALKIDDDPKPELIDMIDERLYVELKFKIQKFQEERKSKLKH